ncbi:hypothetical protein [Lactobacillus xylocopicola]|uniref:Uncharacterized protein n=1 Tax=Lactobacillus xylocopicola TaxID=2976676 RepID=A0ABN6SI89_9LACO|nr:hypothetical protein [Lactobacillus xylocopicola]BDR60040.1 hypothetical protein KIM322_03010 [Lactobacillus xylocopicola]
MNSSNQQITKGLFEKYQEKQNKVFGQKIFPLSATYIFSLKNGLTLNVTEYPELKQLGYWIQPADQINLRVWSHLSQPALAQKFSEITGIKSEQYYLGAVSGVQDLWSANSAAGNDLS